jgi:hypothetical protein
MNKDGLLAARRKRKWKIYDVRTFKNGLAQCMGKATVGANLFEIVFDLSFAHYGSLLVYDPRHQIRDRILNRQSIIFPGWKDDAKANGRTNGNGGAAGERPGAGDALPAASIPCQDLIARSVMDLGLGQGVEALKRKRRLIELARVDGAVVFDDQHLLAVGAIIRSHPDVGSQLGARTTAAKSAYLWGAHPVKVSSDGDVTIYFKSRKGSNSCDAAMHFL